MPAIPANTPRDPTTLLSAVPIANTGTAFAENVQLNNVKLPNATLTIPASLPFGVGTIAAGGSVVLNTEFAGAFVPLGSYPLKLSGTYAVGAATYCFELTSFDSARSTGFHAARLRADPVQPGERRAVSFSAA